MPDLSAVAHATQTIFGEGAVPSSLLIVGEQPGDREDLDGPPFVGPAGRVLDRALEESGMRGKRRPHKTPAQRKIEACSFRYGIAASRRPHRPLIP